MTGPIPPLIARYKVEGVENVIAANVRVARSIDPVAAGMAKANVGTQAWERGLSKLSAQHQVTAGSAGKLFGAGGILSKSVADLSASSVATGLLTKAVGGLGAAYLATKVVGFIHDQVEAAAALHELSQQTGATVETLSILQFAGKQAGVETGDLAVAFKKLATSLGGLRDGSKESVQAFAAIGLSAQDLVGLSVDEVFKRVALAIGQLPPGFDRAEAAVKIFGRSGAELIPLLEDLATNGFDKAREQAEKFNAVVSGEQAKQADEFSDSLKRFGSAAAGVGRDIGLALIPPLTKLLEFINTPIPKATVDRWREIQGLGALTAAAPSGGAVSNSAIRDEAFTPHVLRPRLDKNAARDAAALAREAAAAEDRRALAERDAARWMGEQREDLERILAASAKIADTKLLERLGRMTARQLDFAGHVPVSDLAKPNSIMEEGARQHAEALANAAIFANELVDAEKEAAFAAQNLGQSLREGVAGEIVTFFTEGIAGAENLGEAFAAMGRGIIRTLLQVEAQLLASQLVKLLFSAGGIPAAPGGLNPNDFSLAPKFHSGGMIPGSGEVGITALAGEMVVNRAATLKHYDLLRAINADALDRLTLNTPRINTYHGGGIVAPGGGGTSRVLLEAPEGWGARVESDDDRLAWAVRHRRALNQVLNR